MTVSPIDWTTAATSGITDFNQLIQKSAGLIVLGLDDFKADPSVTKANKIEAFQKLATATGDSQALLALLSGQASTGALALGTGQGGPTTEQEALAFLLQAGSVPPGVKQALRRLMNSQDPAHIAVGVDGTPVEVGQLRQQVATVTAERDDAIRQLTAAQSSSGIAALKTAVKAELDKIQAAWGHKRVSRTNGTDSVVAQADQTVISDAITAMEGHVA